MASWTGSATAAGADGQPASGRVRRVRTLRTFWGPLVAVLLIPLLYSVLYLWAYWDPYARLANLPVAVVNEDRGASYQGEQVQLGDELVSRLRSDQNLHWVVMSRAEAEQALHDGRVYMVMVIPRDFSQRAVHIGDAGALRATIRLETNPASNFLAAQMGESAARRIHQVLSEELTERFVSETLAAVREGVAGLEAATEAGRKLEEGMREATQAAGRLTAGAHDLGRGVEELRAGTVRLASGSDRLAGGLERSTEAAGHLRAGTAELATAGVTLRDAATTLAGSTRSLAAGLQEAATGAAELARGAGEVERGIDQLDRGAGELAAAGEAMGDRLAAASTGVRRLDEALDAWARAHGLEGDPALATIRDQLADLAGGLDEAAASAGQVARGAAQLRDGTRRLRVAQQEVATGAGQLAAQLDKAAGGSSTLARGAAELAGGTAELASHLDELAAGMDQWASGQASLQAGARDLQAGLHRAVAGTAELTSGTRQLAGGADALARGLRQLEQGQHALAAALEDRAGAARAAEVPVQETADRVASPVQLAVGKLHDVPNWGTGFTPYFLPLSLFVGAMILSLPRLRSEQDAAAAARSARDRRAVAGAQLRVLCRHDHRPGARRRRRPGTRAGSEAGAAGPVHARRRGHGALLWGHRAPPGHRPGRCGPVAGGCPVDAAADVVRRNVPPGVATGVLPYRQQLSAHDPRPGCAAGGRLGGGPGAGAAGAGASRGHRGRVPGGGPAGRGGPGLRAPVSASRRWQALCGTRP